MSVWCLEIIYSPVIMGINKWSITYPIGFKGLMPRQDGALVHQLSWFLSHECLSRILSKSLMMGVYKPTNTTAWCHIEGPSKMLLNNDVYPIISSFFCFKVSMNIFFHGGKGYLLNPTPS